MKLGTTEIKNIAHLAQLGVDESELSNYQKDLSQIITLVNEMQSVDTKGVEPLAHPFDMRQRLRIDKVTEEDQRDKLQSVAPLVEKGLFKVPKVIE